MTPAERSALHAALDGLINAGASIAIDGYLDRLSSPASPWRYAQVLAVLDDLAEATGLTVDNGKVVKQNLSRTEREFEVWTGMHDHAAYGDLRQHPAYVRRQPQHVPSSPAITYPPGRADRHYTHGNDAGIA